MKKLFNWIIEHTRHYMWLHYLYLDEIEMNKNLKAKTKRLEEENKEIKILLGKSGHQLIEIEKIINRYNNAKDIKKYIKEVL